MMDRMSIERKDDRLGRALKYMNEVSTLGKSVMIISDTVPGMEMLHRYKSEICEDIPETMGWCTVDEDDYEGISRHIKRFNPDVVVFHFVESVVEKVDLGGREYKEYPFCDQLKSDTKYTCLQCQHYRDRDWNRCIDYCPGSYGVAMFRQACRNFKLEDTK